MKRNIEAIRILYEQISTFILSYFFSRIRQDDLEWVDWDCIFFNNFLVHRDKKIHAWMSEIWKDVLKWILNDFWCIYVFYDQFSKTRDRFADNEYFTYFNNLDFRWMKYNYERLWFNFFSNIYTYSTYFNNIIFLYEQQDKTDFNIFLKNYFIEIILLNIQYTILYSLFDKHKEIFDQRKVQFFKKQNALLNWFVSLVKKEIWNKTYNDVFSYLLAYIWDDVEEKLEKYYLKKLEQFFWKEDVIQLHKEYINMYKKDPNKVYWDFQQIQDFFQSYFDKNSIKYDLTNWVVFIQLWSKLQYLNRNDYTENILFDKQTFCIHRSLFSALWTIFWYSVVDPDKDKLQLKIAMRDEINEMMLFNQIYVHQFTECLEYIYESLLSRKGHNHDPRKFIRTIDLALTYEPNQYTYFSQRFLKYLHLFLIKYNIILEYLKLCDDNEKEELEQLRKTYFDLVTMLEKIYSFK